MTIPEISSSQLELLYSVTLDPMMATTGFVFAQHDPLPSDPPEMRVNILQAKLDAHYLCTIGLLRDISAENVGELLRHAQHTGRTWTLFEISKIARQVFSLPIPKTIH